jgi:hypothetical protein
MRAPHSPVEFAPLDDRASRRRASVAGAPNARKLEGRSPVVAREQGLNGFDRDQPAAADLDRAQRAGADEHVDGRAGEAVRSRSFVDPIGTAEARSVDLTLSHRIASCFEAESGLVVLPASVSQANGCAGASEGVRSASEPVRYPFCRVARRGLFLIWEMNGFRLASLGVGHSDNPSAKLVSAH